MSELRKTFEGGTFFVTLTVVGWIDVFVRREYNDIVVENLRYCQKHKDLELFAYVIMSSHLHMIVRRRQGELSSLLRDFKSYTAKTLLKEIENNPAESRKDWLLHMFRYHAKFQKQNSKNMFWQKTNYPVELFSPHVIDQKIDYIHHNPVQAGIVTEASSYAYSSANPFSVLETVVP